MYPTIQILSIEISSYRLIMALCVLYGLTIIAYTMRQQGYAFKQALWLMISVVIAFFTGARLLNIALNYPLYYTNPSAVWALEPVGFSIVGGALLGALVMYYAMKKLMIAPYQILDALSIPFLISVSLAKLGCFCNGCCFGKVTTSVLGVVLPQKMSSALDVLGLFSLFSPLERVHPTPLYELIGALFLALSVHVITKQYRLLTRRGAVFWLSALMYSALRTALFPLRQFPYPPLMINVVYPTLYIGLIALSWYMFRCRLSQSAE